MTERQASYTTTGDIPVTVVPDDNGLREFFIVLRRALLMIVRWIEKRYPDTLSG